MSALKEFDRLSGKLFLGGEYVASKSTENFSVVDPATEERVGEIADASEAEVEQALDIALDAGRSWNAMDMRSRAVVMHEIAAVMRRDKAIYAECLTREEGKPFKEALDEVSWCATAISEPSRTDPKNRQAASDRSNIFLCNAR